MRDASGDPVPIGPPLVDVGAGLHAAVGILAALRRRDRTGQGEFVEVSLLATALALNGPALVKGTASRPVPRDSDVNLGADPAYRVYRTADHAHVALGALEPKFWVRVCELIGRPDLVGRRTSDPRGTIVEIERLFASRDQRHWCALLEDANVCFSRVNTVSEVLGDPHVVAHGDLTPRPGTAPSVNSPIRFLPEPTAARADAPALGSSSASWD